MGIQPETRIGIPPALYEIEIPENVILRHPCHRVEPEKKTAKLQVFSGDVRPLPTFESAWYLVNIGTEKEPLFLELRFALLSESVSHYIALLMTTERGYQVRDIARRMIGIIEEAGIKFDAALGIPALGVPLAQAMGDIKGADFYWTTCQKGRSDAPLPKPWLDPGTSYSYRSGTKPYEQVLYLDPVLVDLLRDRRIVILDDARLTGGSIDAMVAFSQQLGLHPVAVASVLNEADPVTDIKGVPYFALEKIPVFLRDEQGFHPIESSLGGIDVFYLEQ